MMTDTYQQLSTTTFNTQHNPVAKHTNSCIQKAHRAHSSKTIQPHKKNITAATKNCSSTKEDAATSFHTPFALPQTFDPD